MTHFKRIICIVLDGVGVGEAPDAAAYGDAGSNSIANTARRVGGLRLPQLARMGLGRIVEAEGVEAAAAPTACFGRLQPLAAGKDSTTGHWELMGCVLTTPMPTYPDGFPRDVIGAFESRIGRRVLGNIAASGTEIIEQLGDEHVRTGFPIVYTSQDSVFQIAAHEEIIAREALYRYCEVARELLAAPHAVGRVIARPFRGAPGSFHRTPGRRDYALPPPQPTVLDALVASGRRVLTIGKIDDLFAGRGITRAVHTRDNRDGMNETLSAVGGDAVDFIFTNLVDFDTMWGHRNDARAYALGLEEFDAYLVELMSALAAEDLLIITSDHGNDPTTPSTDHSRELVPLVVWHRRGAGGRDLGLRGSLADVGATIAEAFGVAAPAGASFLADIA